MRFKAKSVSVATKGPSGRVYCFTQNTPTKVENEEDAAFFQQAAELVCLDSGLRVTVNKPDGHQVKVTEPQPELKKKEVAKAVAINNETRKEVPEKPKAKPEEPVSAPKVEEPKKVAPEPAEPEDSGDDDEEETAPSMRRKRGRRGE